MKQFLSGKIHGLRVTDKDVGYTGSVTIDAALMRAAGIEPYEKVQVVNINNGERFETYVIRGNRGTGIICLNGPAARKVAIGDIVIILSYAMMDFEEAKHFRPVIILPETTTNRLIK